MPLSAGSEGAVGGAACADVNEGTASAGVVGGTTEPGLLEGDGVAAGGEVGAVGGVVGLPVGCMCSSAGLAEEVDAAGDVVVGGEDGVAVFFNEDDQLTGLGGEGGLELGGGLADAGRGGEQVGVPGVEVEDDVIELGAGLNEGEGRVGARGRLGLYLL